MYATGDSITVRVTFPQTIQSAMGASLNIRIGENTRAASAPNCSTGCGMSLDFSYTVVAADYDADGVTVAANALSATALTRSQAGTPHAFSLTLPDTLSRPQSDHRVNLGDYDRDDDGLIEVSTLDHLNAIRYDLDGDGGVSATDATNYANAFLNRSATMGCPTTTADADNNDCVGYELAENLDFDTDGDGDVDSNDAYPNWTPIGGTFATTLKGNNRTISNLTINSSSTPLGLFNTLGSSGVITGLGLVDVDITSSSPSATVYVGALAGYISGGTVRATYATGEISQTVGNNFAQRLGGFAGQIFPGIIEASWSGVNVSSNGSTAQIGGIASSSINGTITASYVTGAISATGSSAQAGGLAGSIALGTVSASYVAGPVSSGGNAGGITTSISGATITNTYWDVGATDIPDDSDANMPEGKTTSELQSITEYSGIFANWNVNVDGQTGNDDPWNFGKAMQYPMLKFGGMSVVAQGSLAMGTPGTNGNHPVVGQEAGVCLVDEDGTPNAVHMRAQRAGEPTRKAPWVWQKSADGKTWADIAEDGGATFRYTPVAGDVGNYLRACVALNDSAPEGVDEACIRMFAKVKSSG